MKADLTIDRVYMETFTTGILKGPNNFVCSFLELPYKDNATGISCCPPGIYEYYYRPNSSNGRVLELIGVPDRKAIQIHVGNYLKNTRGCVLVGEYFTISPNGTPMIHVSGKTRDRLLAYAPSKGTISIR